MKKSLIVLLGLFSINSFANTAHNVNLSVNNQITNSKMLSMQSMSGEWSLVGTVGFAENSDSYPEIAIDKISNIPYVVTVDYKHQISVMQFTNNTWKNIGPIGLTSNLYYQPSIAIDNKGTPYIAVSNITTHTSSILVLRFNSETNKWDKVGANEVGSESASNPSIAIDNAGIPYVAYIDSENGDNNYISVERLHDGNWVPAGEAKFTSNESSKTHLVIDNIGTRDNPNGTPYLAYIDKGQATVMRFTNNKSSKGGYWTPVASPIAKAKDIAITLSSNGTPYIAISEYDKISVKKYIDRQWTPVGTDTKISSSGDYKSASIIIDSKDSPYIVGYRYGRNPGKVVMKFVDSGDWNQVGTQQQFGGSHAPLAIDNTDTPYILYIDPTTINLSVMKFINTTVAH